MPKEMMAKWQRVVDLTAQLVDVPACLVMKTTPPDHSVFISSNSPGNPYSFGVNFELNSKLYCHEVIQTKSELVVTDAANSPRWKDNQDIEHGMTFYIGLPVCWPNGDVFGTVCALDTKENQRALERRPLLKEIQTVLESDLVLLTEINRRKEAEGKLQETLAKLEERVFSLAEADKRKDDFLAMLAHELRTPLAPVRAATQLLSIIPTHDKRIPEAAALIERQINQLTRIVDDLLDLSQISQGKLGLHCEAVELSNIFDLTIEAVSPRLNEKNQTLSVFLPDESIFLFVDPNRIAQVFGNLLNNASKFSEDGSTIQLSAETDNSEAVISVKDNGVGIDKEHQDSIFDMFVQVDTSPGRAAEGTGIGLTLVQKLVELHDGDISVHSQGPGTGTEFSIRLPVADQPEKTDNTASPKTSSGRILVVDDYADAAETLSSLLEFKGFDTKTANDGLTAVQIAEKFQPEIIFLDLGMPKVDGFETCRLIRKQSWGKEIAIIALTGSGQADDLRKTKEAGFDSHLMKPATLDALLRTIASAQKK